MASSSSVMASGRAASLIQIRAWRGCGVLLRPNRGQRFHLVEGARVAARAPRSRLSRHFLEIPSGGLSSVPRPTLPAPPRGAQGRLRGSSWPSRSRRQFTMPRPGLLPARDPSPQSRAKSPRCMTSAAGSQGHRSRSMPTTATATAKRPYRITQGPCRSAPSSARTSAAPMPRARRPGRAGSGDAQVWLRRRTQAGASSRCMPSAAGSRGLRLQLRLQRVRVAREPKRRLGNHDVHLRRSRAPEARDRAGDVVLDAQLEEPIGVGWVDASRQRLRAFGGTRSAPGFGVALL